MPVKVTAANFSVEVIADTVNLGHRISSVVLTYPRIILAELNTHRVFSRNSASSRAIPTRIMLETIKNSPFVPIKIPVPAPGMATTKFMEDPSEILRQHQKHLEYTLAFVQECLDKGMPKSLANRYLEPFMMVSTIVTATEWANFLRLRRHKDAETHFTLLAEMTFRAFRASTPRLGVIHAPFALPDELEDLESCYDNPAKLLESAAMKSVVARAARVSYLNHGTPKSDEAAMFDKLVSGSGFGHWSPHEHMAISPTHMPSHATKYNGGNFDWWLQLRQFFNGENLPGHVDEYLDAMPNASVPETIADIPITVTLT
jgi:hypothetical protein